MDKNISFTLKVWRQKGPKDKGQLTGTRWLQLPDWLLCL